MPVLARIFEKAGLSTILVTMMPFWAEKVGAPRTLAVEFPFAQTLGRPHDAAQQRRIILQALHVLETAKTPGTIVHSPDPWPQPQAEALQDWQPPEPSPVIRELGPQIRSLLRERRRRSASPSKDQPTE